MLTSSFEELYQSGEPILSRGVRPTGMLVYTPGGRMIVQVMRDSPVRIETAYFGTFQVNEQEGYVLHNIEGSLDEMEVGRNRKRFYSLLGDTLRLTSPPFNVDGEDRIRRINWLRSRAS